MANLVAYNKCLKKNSIPFDCPHCGRKILPENFDDHCLVNHNLNASSRCVWCFGNKVWPKGQKDKHHLITCFNKFMSQNTPIIHSEEECEKENMFGRKMISNLPYEPIYPLELPNTRPLMYKHYGLNLAVRCIQAYMELDGDWFHIMIRAGAFAPFLEAIKDGKTRTLPFSCCCDAGGLSHRHLIIYSSTKGHFTRNVWRKMDKRNSRKQNINSPMQLVDLLQSLSERTSSCNFSFDDRFRKRDLHHYYITTPLPSLYKLVLAMQWDGGILELINQEYQSVDIENLVPVAESFNGLWGIRIRDLPNIPQKIVLPVIDNYWPCSHATDTFVHLTDGRKMYFEWREEISGDDWLEKQAQKGNLFYDAIGYEVWFPNASQQKCINLAVPLSEKILELELTLEAKEQELTNSTTIVDENLLLRTKLASCEEELKNLQRKHIHYLEKENDILREKMCKRMKTA